GEGLVGRREDGERTIALEGVDQAGRGECGGERVELAGGDGGIDDVALGLVGLGVAAAMIAGNGDGSHQAERERGGEHAEGGSFAGGGGAGHLGSPVGGTAPSVRCQLLGTRTICSCTFV